MMLSEVLSKIGDITASCSSDDYDYDHYVYVLYI